MHLQTHILAGWCLANVPPLHPRQRALAMLAAAWPDLDSISRLWGEEAYWDYHHKLGHNLPLGLLVSAGLALVSPRRSVSFALYLGLFHLHLLMDYFGSGPGWDIYYFWPFSPGGYRSGVVWPLFSWQNLLAAGVLLAWTLLIAHRSGRTPLERLMPALDRQLVNLLRRKHPRGG